LEHSYAVRARNNQEFSGSLQHTADFVELAFTATCTDLKGSDAALVSATVPELRQIQRRTETLRSILLDQMGADLAPSPSATLQASDLERMDLVGFCWRRAWRPE